MVGINQSRAWGAYGQAMAAAAALDLLVKVSNFHDRALELVGDSRNFEAKRAKLVEKATKPHFSQSANEFYESHKELQSDQFRIALDNAIVFRNYLSHQYFSAIWPLLSSEEGLDVIECECLHYKDHFVGIENHILAHGNCEFLQFFQQAADPKAVLENHPVHRFLKGQVESIDEALAEAGYPPQDAND
ncbi:hypothetical protein [Parasphingopyxis sp.]|uniref:hypothetical protein n=1 Tax=Parasphingopyxis sp. TaxID=1920299 RepID=UPI00260BFE9F|nr:hypothetical protein [Parasphingopyxis sp.]